MQRIAGRCFLLIATVLLATRRPARADDFFNVVATGSGGTIATDSGPNIIHLTNDLINEQSAFAPLFGQNVASTLSWGGVPNAIILSENAAQTTATLTFPTTGFTRTFVGASAANLQDQIRDFIKGDGDRAYARFLQSMDRLSPVASLDGNPQASTAIIADDVFTRFGIQNQQPTDYRSYADGSYFGLSGGGGAGRAGDLNSSWANVSIDSGVRFGSNVALSFGTTLAYRDVEDSSDYTVAEEVALPITFINNHGDGISWQVSPFAFAGLSASYDQAAGGLLVGGGGTSSLALHFRNLTVTLGDQISYTGNVAVNVDGYGFDTDIDQWILKNGIDARLRLPRSPFFIEGGASYSNFLHHAAIPNYWTPTLGVGVQLGRFSSLQFAYKGDFAPHYNDNGGQVVLVLAY